ncbi:MAG: ABC transporter ATP-binding protein [Chloroflexi bacterium]|nr:ABC transporter ATP-binding protein [Chloroflexota bacterium]
MTNHSTPVIQTDNLSKVYRSGNKEVQALNNLNLSVRQGEIFGYLGPNGAGKTTTIRLLLDLIRPTGGSASLFGLDAQRDSVAIHRRIGFLPGELNLWKNLTGTQVIDYVARVRGGVDRKLVNQLSERLDFDASKRVRDYSSGNRRKLGLILALMNQPELLILDEPTNGLDPLVQQTFNDLMREIRAEGRTVFLSSHMLGEVQSICDRVGILRGGQLQAVESVAALRRVDFEYVTIRFRDPVRVDVLAGLPGVTNVTVDGNTVRLCLHGDYNPLLVALRDQYIVDIDTEEPSLEDIFLSYYGNGTNAHKPAETVKEMAS